MIELYPQKMTKIFNNILSKMNYFFEEPPEVQIDLREQEFHNMIRENVVFLLILMSLYGLSYVLIYMFRKKKEEEYANEEDALVYRISFWMCTFALAVSIGSAFLLPFSIVTNEVIIFYPQNYYIQWLNDSLIQGLWNYVFLFSNISLFVLLPFAYFFTESEGFAGSSRGIMSRVNETIVLLLLLMVLVLGITYLLCCTLGYSELALSNLLTIWHYLPLLYSCVSFIGVILLLLCTPIGFAVLFTVLGDFIVKPRFLRDIQQEFEIALLEEMHLKRNLELKKKDQSFINEKSCMCTSRCNYSNLNHTDYNYFDYCKSKSLPTFNSFLSEVSLDCSPLTINNTSILEKTIKTHDISEFKEQFLNETLNNSSFGHLSCIKKRRLFDATSHNQQLDKNKNLSSSVENFETSVLEAEKNRKNLEKLKQASSLRRNIGYPIAILSLFCLTILSIFMVIKNILELLVGIKALPMKSAHRFTLGITSLYKLGYFGAILEILLILYLWNTSLVGLYSLPFLKKIRPKLHNTSFTKVIINCALLLMLSSALPVLARTVGITNFDLLGDFGRIEWLGNFYVVLFYNVVFVSLITITLTKKLAALMRKELFKRISSLWLSTTNSTNTSNMSSSLKSNSISLTQTFKNSNNSNSFIHNEQLIVNKEE